ncbi:OmpA family protein [Hafnia alvei]|uniref:OmpA family protein n=1 Tax=Hafnia alvei TaxID=569 RepID=A0ABD7PZG4_HAFAL|nr:OmpA family protein [Hafnia alvei]TBL65002.1 OmpA family protein [Hafnia alvei]
MRDIYRALLTALAVFFALWLILGFWPLSMSSQVALCLLVILVGGVVLWREWRVLQRGYGTVNEVTEGSLPPEDFQGAVILACGDSAALFGTETRHRETRQGWYLQVNDAEQLPQLVQHLSLVRPALVSQISVLLATLPEHHHSLDDFTQCLRGWQRSVVQCRPWLGGLPPVWSVTWVSPPGDCVQEAPVWFTTANHRAGMQVHQPGQGNVQLADWLDETEPSGRFSRLSQALWLNSLLVWQGGAVNSLLKERLGELSALRLCAQGFCMVPVSGRNDNLWQQHIAGITALPPESGRCAELLPLPELLLSGLPRRRGISRRMMFWRHVGLLAGVFLALSMLASFVNNERLIRSVGDHLALYHRLSGEPPAPKSQAQQRLRADARLLDDWQRRGEPLRYRMGLYQGLRLVAPVEAAVSDWAPPAPPAPIIQKIVQGPKTVRLDSLSLFDSGKFALKPGSTKMLVNSLMGIRAKPGWLIVVSGHTDNVGHSPVNQTLSQKRAEAVRDWMRDTGDVPESCFAVQGYGESRPVATNDTPEGRALNRRVEISLVPQANACQIPDTKPASPDERDVSTQ